MTIHTPNYDINLGNQYYEKLSALIQQNNYSKIIILVDENTSQFCLPYFLQNLKVSIPFETLEIPHGESNKSLEICINLWNTLLDYEIDRNALLINLGGGLISDLGGFIAATFKRGIHTINIPTTLLAMVDASIGGKTGINFGKQKNMIGTFTEPQHIIIDVHFLNTLPASEMRSGLAEIYKHGLIADKKYWNKLQNLNELTTEDLETIIHQSVVIKNNIVTNDLTEQNSRKKLNFGHTIGHAIESFSHASTSLPTLLHGEAIAIGMIIESYLSMKTNLININDYTEIKNTLLNIFDKVTFTTEMVNHFIDSLANDKKNNNGAILFTLLKSIGEAIINQKVDLKFIHEAFLDYNNY